MRSWPGRRRSLASLTAQLEALGASLTVVAPGREPLRLGRRPAAARVVFHTKAALDGLLRRDHLALAEAYLDGEVEIGGDWSQVMAVTEIAPPDPTRLARLGFALRALLRSRRSWQRESIAFHYDRPPGFFLPWFERWRSYSHGFYATPHDAPEDAQARKLRFAVDALGLKPGAHVFDMGCGWGSFLEYAGRQGIHVHGITISREQHRFVSALIERDQLPCSVELVDFLDFRPPRRFDGAVFMGTFEHFPGYRRAARWLERWLEPQAKLYADFCTARSSYQVGAFLARHIWPGTSTYVDVPRVLRALGAVGFTAHELRDDTRSYAYTVRDWADAFDGACDALAAEFDARTVRAFRLFLRASQYYLERGKTQACHLVAGRVPAGTEDPS
jgi:cyclopropane-fatty-acyl-phospholipid synthase